MSTAPWVPFDVEGWAELVDALPPEWPRSAAVFDLRVYDNRERMTGRRVPSSRKLATRWGWGHKRVRLLMKREELWRRGAQRGHTEGTRGAQEGHKTSTQTPAITTTEGTAGAHEGHSGGTRGATRADLKKKERRRKKEEDPLSPAIELAWKRYLENSEIVLPDQSQSLSAKRRRQLRAAINKHDLESVTAVFDWWGRSCDSRAVFLRGRGLGFKTIFNPENFDDYLSRSKLTESQHRENNERWRGGGERKMSPIDALEESVRQRKAEEARAAAGGGGDSNTVLLFPDGGEIAVNDDEWVEIPF